LLVRGDSYLGACMLPIRLDCRIGNIR